MTIYKSAVGKKKILELYDKQLERLGTAYSDKWVSTFFGETHLIETGNPAGMPVNVAEKDMKKCKAPALVMAGEKDCLFPAKRVLPTAERIIQNATTYLLEGRGHMSSLTEGEKQMITEFLRRG